MSSVKRTHHLDSAFDRLQHAAELALTGAGHILAQGMQEKAPLDTGRMTRSVHVSEVMVGLESGDIAVFVGPTVEYAKYTEEEPWIIGKRPGPKSQIKGATIPWMRPSLRDRRDEITKFIEDGLRVTVRALGH